MSDIIQSTTQQFLDIYDITNNFVIMKDGTVSTILTVDAMNFGLLAEEEQDAIMYAYAGLLNSLNYSIQIIINSRTKDVTSYLKVLQEQETVAETETLRRRIRMYREFVGNLIHERNVLDKKFYVVIPAAAVEMGFLTASSVIPGQTQAFDISTIERSVIIEKAQNLLDPKRDHLIAQFARIGLFSRQLTTQEIIQLFYIQYNPEAAEGQQIGESSSYTTPLVKASLQGTSMNNQPQPIPVAQVAQARLDAVQPVPETLSSGMTDPQLSTPELLQQVGPMQYTTQPVVPTAEPAPAPVMVAPVPEIKVAEQPPVQQQQVVETTPTVPNPASPVAPVLPVAEVSTTPSINNTLPVQETESAPVIPQNLDAVPTPPTPRIPDVALPVVPQPPPHHATAAPAAVPAEMPVVGDLETQQMPTTPVVPSETIVQADLNAAVQEFTTDTTTTTPSANTPKEPELPPLPEI